MELTERHVRNAFDLAARSLGMGLDRPPKDLGVRYEEKLVLQYLRDGFSSTRELYQETWRAQSTESNATNTATLGDMLLFGLAFLPRTTLKNLLPAMPISPLKIDIEWAWDAAVAQAVQAIQCAYHEAPISEKKPAQELIAAHTPYYLQCMVVASCAIETNPCYLDDILRQREQQLLQETADFSLDALFQNPSKDD